MKINLSIRRGLRSVSGMTLAEMMVSVSIYSLMFAGFISVILFAMKQDQLTNSKLGANDQSRENFSLLLDEIRASKNIQIGHGNYTNFVALTNGALQQGETLQIIPSTNLNIYIYYVFDTNQGTLTRAAYNNGTVTTNLVASCLTNMTSQWLTNSMTFRAMDYTGTTNLTVDPTNYNFNYVVNILMQFYQYQYPLTTIGTNCLYNYYQLTYSATRRSP
jgi:Tfp pilus assembly protein PilW